MAAAAENTRFCLRIKGFRAVAERQQVPALQLKDALIKEVRETFGKAFAGHETGGGRSLISFLGRGHKKQSEADQSIIKEVLEDEVVLSDWLTLDQCEKVLVHLKESDRFKKLSIESGITSPPKSEELIRTLSFEPMSELQKRTSDLDGFKTPTS